jgi:DNA mismatch repair protein MutS
LQPSELIHVDWQPAQSSLHGLIELFQPLLSTVESWRTELGTATELLQRHFQVASLDGFGLHGKPQAIRAAAAVLAYLQQMQPAALAQLTRLQSYETHEFMTLDEATRRNLELTETIRSGEARGSLLGVLDKTLTPMGGRLLRRWLNQPLLDVAAIHRRLEAVQGFVDNTTVRLELRERLRGLGDLERWTNRVLQGVAIPRDLVGIREVLRRAPEIQRLGDGEVGRLGEHPITPSPHHPITQLFELPLCEDILSLLEAALADEPPATLATPGIVRPGYSAELDELLDRSRHAKDWIANLEVTERERLDIKSLKVGYNKVFGYYIEITNAHAQKAPADYIRKQTLTNAERYITPDLKEYEALVLNADERRLDIEQQIFKDLCREVRAAAERLLHLANTLAELDGFATLAEVALYQRYVRPEVNDGACIEIKAGRHPVVELTLTDEPFVPNDTYLTPDAALHILTGPNMAGKSTFLRQVALIVLMAQIGSFVPADAAQIGVVDRIFTRIGASDEIHRGQSTFMVEMVETANILNHATSRSLLVLDEIGRGTSTYDGLAIAWAVVEYIHNHPGLRAKTLFATHYHELTDLAERLPHVVNYFVAVDDRGAGRQMADGGWLMAHPEAASHQPPATSHHQSDGQDVVFLRRILPGKADRSYGVHVARMAGLPQAAVQRAEEILYDLERSGAAGPRRLLDLESKGGKKAAMQVSLFAEVHPVVEALRKLDVNSLTPLEALNRLFELQKLAK